jgi:CDP-paratose 2-epimerase
MGTKMKKLIITGGTGFIGCNAAAHFRRAGANVVVVDNLSRRGSEANLAWLRDQGVEQFIRADVTNADAMNDLMAQHADADAVLHLAAQVAVTSSVADPRADFEANALGTFNVLEAVRVSARGRPAFLYASTNKVYGCLDNLPVVQRQGRYAYQDLPRGVGECEPLDFHSPYGCSKGASDQYVLDYARIYNMKTVSFRQSCIYGTRQFGVEDQGWVAWFCIAALTGEPLTIYGDGKQVRDTLWVGDLVECYERSLERIDAIRGEAFNIGGGPANTLSLLELVERIERRLGDRLELAFADWRPGDQRVFVADVDKAERLLGWSPRVGVTEGLDRLLAWVDDHRFLFSKTVARTSRQTSTLHGDSRGKQPDRLSASPSQFSPSVDGSFPSHNDIHLDEIAQR